MLSRDRFPRGIDLTAVTNELHAATKKIAEKNKAITRLNHAKTKAEEQVKEYAAALESLPPASEIEALQSSHRDQLRQLDNLFQVSAAFLQGVEDINKTLMEETQDVPDELYNWLAAFLNLSRLFEFLLKNPAVDKENPDMRKIISSFQETSRKVAHLLSEKVGVVSKGAASESSESKSVNKAEPLPMIRQGRKGERKVPAPTKGPKAVQGPRTRDAGVGDISVLETHRGEVVALSKELKDTKKELQQTIVKLEEEESRRKKAEGLEARLKSQLCAFRAKADVLEKKCVEAQDDLKSARSTWSIKERGLEKKISILKREVSLKNAEMDKLKEETKKANIEPRAMKGEARVGAGEKTFRTEPKKGIREIKIPVRQSAPGADPKPPSPPSHPLPSSPEALPSPSCPLLSLWSAKPLTKKAFSALSDRHQATRSHSENSDDNGKGRKLTRDSLSASSSSEEANSEEEAQPWDKFFKEV